MGLKDNLLIFSGLAPYIKRTVCCVLQGLCETHFSTVTDSGEIKRNTVWNNVKKEYRGRREVAPLILSSALDGGEW